MDIDQLIRNWHEKSSEEEYFSAFVFEYLAFIAFLKKKKFIDGKISDRAAIQRIKRETAISEKYLQRMDKSTKESWLKIKMELDRNPLGNVSSNGNDSEDTKWWNCSTDQCPDIKKKGTIKDISDWENMVEFWYSIRNNLFHGGKNPQDGRDEFLVKYGYMTLRPLVEIFITNDN